MNSEAEPFIERVQLGPSLSVMCDQGGRFWIHRVALFDFSGLCSTSLLEKSNSTITQALLDAALTAGMGLFNRPAEAPAPMTLTRNIWNLLNSYQTTHATPPALAIAARRFEESGRHDVAEYTRQKLAEETGHDDIALKDLSSLGLPAQELVEQVVAPLVCMGELMRKYAESESPIAIFGYSYVLERLATFRDQSFIDAVKATTPEGVNASRTWVIHSAVGSDCDHVRELVEFISNLNADEREVVVQAVYETAKLQESQTPLANDEEIHAYLGERGVDLRSLCPSIV